MNGAIIINKPTGCTSRDVVNKLTKILGTRQIGHTGTLDPIASGVLVCLVGKYTKLTDILVNHNKEYIATFQLGILTDTLDITGKILKEKECTVNKEVIISKIMSFKKTYEQEVPAFSAVKINGKRLYEYARNNEIVDLPTRVVTIQDIDIININDNVITIKVKVSKGTYIRSLIRDIGQSLNTYATMLTLERTELGNFHINSAVKLQDAEAGLYHLYSAEELLNCEVKNIDENLLFKVKNGQILEMKIDNYIIFKYNNKEVAIYQQYLTSTDKIYPLVIF